MGRQGAPAQQECKKRKETHEQEGFDLADRERAPLKADS
jgi:hypothetical protein